MGRVLSLRMFPLSSDAVVLLDVCVASSCRASAVTCTQSETDLEINKFIYIILCKTFRKKKLEKDNTLFDIWANNMQ